MMSLRKSFALAMVAAVLAASPLAAQRGGARGAVTARLSAPDRPSAADRIRSGPGAMPRPDALHPRHRKPRFHRYIATPVLLFARDRTATPAYRNDELIDAVQDTRQAALDARQAALDARQAALDVREAVSGRPDPGDGERVLQWKPGGITPAGDGTAARAGRAVVFENGDGIRPVRKPAAGAFRAPAVRVGLRIEPVAFELGAVPWWAADPCTWIWQLPRQQGRPHRRRLPWGLGWLYRYGRDVEVERGNLVAPSFYMRSPLLSGLYLRPDCDDQDTACAEVRLVGDERDVIAFEVALPQLGAETPGTLRDHIRSGLESTGTVVLRTTDGEEFELMQDAVHEVHAQACTRESA